MNPILSQGLDMDVERVQTPIASPADPGHRDHALLEQIRAAVRAMNGENANRYDADSCERISRSLLAQCKDQRDAYPHTRNEPLAGRELGRVDRVLMGGPAAAGANIFAVEGRLDDPSHRRAFVNAERAAQTPVDQSDRKLEAANRQISQDLGMAQQQEFTRGLNDPHRSGPAMSR